MGPLSGIRVIEMVGLGPAPLATGLMADLGARVIRIDRDAEPPPSALDPLNRDRPAVRLDLKDGRAVAGVLDLVPSVDAMIDPFRPGVMERLGLGPEACLERNPRLAYARMTGWGQEGPYASVAGHDINYVAMAGALHELDDGTRPPHPPLNLLGDYAGGSMFLIVGLLAAVMQARESGHGQVVDVAMIDGAAALLRGVAAAEAAGQWQPDSARNHMRGAAPYYRVYATADDRYIAVGAVEPHFYANFIAGLGLDPAQLPPQDDTDGWPATRERIAEIVSSRPQAHWVEVFAHVDACVTPVLTRAEAARHPQFAKRGVYLETGGALWPSAAPRFGAADAVPAEVLQADAGPRAILVAAGVAEPVIDAFVRRIGR
jgi:alpha-methylacyl-CoA racemase